MLIAAGGGPLDPEPTWDRYDELDNCRCEGFQSFAGRQSEFDTTDTGNARVFFHDRAGVLNSTDLVGKQILLQLRNPVTDEWHPRWRGHIDDVVRKTDPFAPLSDTQLVCVGIFDYLGGVKFVPGEMGDVPPAGMNGIVFYEDGPADERAESVLTDAQVDPEMYVVFSLNVDVNETLYDVDDVALQALRDVVDADFPGLANVYEDRFGRVCAHGYQSRFDPDTVAAGAGDEAWDFQRWPCATAPNVTTGVAQIREFGFNIPRARIINSWVGWPREDENGAPWDRAGIAAQVRVDTASRDEYGWRGKDAPDLIVKEHKTNGDTGAEHLQRIAEFYIGNYAEPRRNIQTLTLRSLRPTDARAAATFEAMCRMDVSDIVEANVAEEGIDEDFFVEGVDVACRPTGNPSFDWIEVTPNLSPASYYGTNPFEDA